MSNPIQSWLELESDPGLFSLLLREMGVKGVEVEDVYDLNEKWHAKHTYGFIFLFKWIDEKPKRRGTADTLESTNYLTDSDRIKKMFYAKQIIPNSCATHSLLSIVMNVNNLDVGPNLLKLKNLTQNLNSEDKGYAIANIPELAHAHHKFAKKDKNFSLNVPKSTTVQEKRNTDSIPNIDVVEMDTKDFIDTDSIKNITRSHTPTQLNTNVTTSPAKLSNKNMEEDCFHYVSFIPIDGELYELDGLRPYPISHGPWNPNEEWTDKLRRIIISRISNKPIISQVNIENINSSNLTLSQMSISPIKSTLTQQSFTNLSSNSISTTISNDNLSNNLISVSNEIRYNLMVVCKEKRTILRNVLMAKRSHLYSALQSLPVTLRTFEDLFQLIVAENMEKMRNVLRKTKERVFMQSFKTNIPTRVRNKFYSHSSLKEILSTMHDMHTDIINIHTNLKKENEKWDRYKIENSRRIHEYGPFIQAFIQALARHNMLKGIIENHLPKKSSLYTRKIRKMSCRQVKL